MNRGYKRGRDNGKQICRSRKYEIDNATDIKGGFSRINVSVNFNTRTEVMIDILDNLPSYSKKAKVVKKHAKENVFIILESTFNNITRYWKPKNTRIGSILIISDKPKGRINCSVNLLIADDIIV